MGSTSVKSERPENYWFGRKMDGRIGLEETYPTWLEKIILNFFLRSAQKWPIKIDKTFFFDPPKNKKSSVQKVPPYGIYGDIEHLKLIYTHQAHQSPPKTHFYFNKTGF